MICFDGYDDFFEFLFSFLSIPQFNSASFRKLFCWGDETVVCHHKFSMSAVYFNSLLQIFI